MVPVGLCTIFGPIEHILRMQRYLCYSILSFGFSWEASISGTTYHVITRVQLNLWWEMWFRCWVVILPGKIYTILPIGQIAHLLLSHFMDRDVGKSPKIISSKRKRSNPSLRLKLKGIRAHIREGRRNFLLWPEKILVRLGFRVLSMASCMALCAGVAQLNTSSITNRNELSAEERGNEIKHQPQAELYLMKYCLHASLFKAFTVLNMFHFLLAVIHYLQY